MSDSSARRPQLDTPPESGGGSPSAGTIATAKGETTELELTRAQHTFARRVAESQATIPHLTLQVQVDLEECVAGHGGLSRLVDESAAAGGVETADAADGPPTCTAEVLRACALALREHPRVNSNYRDGRVQMHSRVNIGVAVSVEAGEAGAAERAMNAVNAQEVGTAREAEPVSGTTAIAPTVFDANTLATDEIAEQIDDLRARARAGALAPPELSGATFTVVDLGADGADSFAATVIPGQAAILTIGSLRPRPVALDGQLVAHRTTTLTLSCDHRVLYAADAARFLVRIRELLEAPAALRLR